MVRYTNGYLNHFQSGAELRTMDFFSIRRWWQIPYYWFGIKMYDIVAGSKTVKSSYYLSRRNALELFPMLKGDKLTGAIVYYDGKQYISIDEIL